MNRSRRFTILALSIIAALTTVFAAMLLSGALPRYVSAVRNLVASPEAAMFVPQGQQIAIVPASTKPLVMLLPTPTLVATRAVISAESTPTSQPTTATPNATPQPTATPSPAPTSIPAKHLINGIDYQDQLGLWNYCGPSNLAMLVSFWGEPTDRLDTGGFMRGSVERYDDKNVSPDEMLRYVEEKTGLAALVRVGGTLDVLKGLISAEIPVIVEIGYTPDDPTDWMGHYLLLNGYDDATQQFISQDTYKGSDEPYTYDALTAAWRAFNDTFFVIYPPEREAEIMSLLGDLQDEHTAAAIALDVASEQAASLTGQQRYFAQLNMVDSYAALGDFNAAATILDNSFITYANLSQGERPWRTLWYRFEPFETYFMVGRYQDAINLADTTLNNMAEPILEEVYYWRAVARYESGQHNSALADMQQVIALNARFKDAEEILLNWQQ